MAWINRTTTEIANSNTHSTDPEIKPSESISLLEFGGSDEPADKEKAKQPSCHVTYKYST
jgi:hypothetical protein